MKNFKKYGKIDKKKIKEVILMNEKELKKFTVGLIESKEKENENYIRYSYYELKVKYNLSEEEIDEVLKISRDYFENKGYKVYFTNAEFEYQNAKRKVEINEYLIAFKEYRNEFRCKKYKIGEIMKKVLIITSISS